MTSFEVLQPVLWEAGGARLGNVYVHTFSSLGREVVFTLAVRGVDSQDATGPVATVKCSTALRDMLTLECNANALLVAEFSDPYADTGITPTNYTVRITKAGDTQSTTRRVQDTFVFTGAEYGAQYTVTVTASHGTGWAQYTETDTVTCPTQPEPPPTVSGLKCSAATSDSLTITWDSAADAASYEVQASSFEVPQAALWEAGGARSGNVYMHTFSSLGREVVFTLAVRGVDSQDATGPAATVKCSTALRDMLTLECNANALLVSEFSDPYADTGITPTDYTVLISNVGDRQHISRRVQDTIVFTDAAYGAQYMVTVVATYRTGWAYYIETDTVTCPTHTDNWNSPNFFDRDEDCPGLLGQALCDIGEAARMQASIWRLRGPSFSPHSAERVLLTRRCAFNDAQTSRTCYETWAENITLLKDPNSVWEALGLTEWNTLEDWGRNLSTISGLLSLSAAMVAVTSAYAWVTFGISGGSGGAGVIAYISQNNGVETLKLFPTVSAAIAAGTPLNTANVAGCLSPYEITSRSETITEEQTYGSSFTDTRISTYHYCDPNE